MLLIKQTYVNILFNLLPLPSPDKGSFEFAHKCFCTKMLQKVSKKRHFEHNMNIKRDNLNALALIIKEWRQLRRINKRYHYFTLGG